MNYPTLPYSIRLQTQTDTVWMIWDDTAWDTPSPVTYSSDSDQVAEAVKDFFTTHSIGFQGYPIEDINRPAPMDIHAVLTANKSDLIQDFAVIGFIPEAPTAPDQDIEPEEDFEEDADEPPVKPVLESIPQNMKIRLPFILEDTGETVFIETDAQEALDESNSEVALYESILKRMES